MRQVHVLEIGSSVATAWCTRLFGACGAEVVCIEPPEGSGLRKDPPFVDDGEVSARWEYLAAGKRSVVADLGSQDAEALIAWADVVVSWFDGEPDEAAALHQRIEAIDASTVHVVVSGFGLTGPYRTWKSSHLIDWAAGGHLYLTGEPDREPLQGGGPWVSYLTGAVAAIGGMAAMIHSARTGEGQLVDVAAMEAAASLHQWTITQYTHIGCVKRRWGNRFGESVHPIALYRCTDGWISIVAPAPAQWEALCLALELYDFLIDERLDASAERFDRADEIDARINGWLAGRTCEEAIAFLQDSGVPASPLLSFSGVLDEPQLAARGVWTEPDHLAPGARMPDVPFRLVDGATRAGRAPDIGEHTDEVMAEARTPDNRRLPRFDLREVRLLEFGVAWAGPLASRFMGDLGVDVVKVEHPASRGVAARPREEPWSWGDLPDPQVRFPVFPLADPGDRWWNRMGIHNKMNRSKRSVSLDAKKDGGGEALQALIAASDVVLHNFSPRGSRSLGIDAEGVGRVNDRALTVAMTGYGETGPLSGHLSYGPVLQAHAGLDEATGYEGAGPSRIGVAFPDAVAGVHGAVAVLAGLWERELRNDSVHIDLSQFETVVAICGDALLAASTTGADPVRRGNRSLRYAPQALLPCSGDDAWLALTVTDDDAWRRLIALLEVDLDLDDADGWSSLEVGERFERQAQIDELVSRWTLSRSSVQAGDELQGAGIAACPVMTNEMLVHDPHLAAREFVVQLDQPDVGPIGFPGFPIHFSTLEPVLRPCAPLGGDNNDVLRDFAGFGDEQIAALRRSGAITDEPAS